MKLKIFCFITILFTAIFLSGAELQPSPGGSAVHPMRHSKML